LRIHPRSATEWTKAALLSSAVFGFVRYLTYFLRKRFCNFVFKILNKIKIKQRNHNHILLLWKKIKYVQNKQGSVTSIKWLCTRCGNTWWRIECSWWCPGRDKCEEVPNVAYKIKITKKLATFCNDICKFLLEAADQEWILQKVVLMMGKYGGCRCDTGCFRSWGVPFNMWKYALF
jgi:hypothetical protein